MNGFSYARRGSLSATIRRADIAPALRTALAVLALTLLASIGIGTLEHHRLAELDRRLNALRTEASSAAIAARRAGAAARDFARLRAVANRIDEARRETTLSTNAAILIGNHLPPRTWLTELDALPSGGWSIVGKSAALDQIGATLAALAPIDPAATVRLVSVTTLVRPANSYAFVISWDRGR
jgi:hypothetical protein